MARLTVLRHEVVVGWFILFALVLGGALLVLHRGTQTLVGSTRTVHFHVEHGQGLRKGSLVLVQGIQVGEIGEIGLTRDNRVRVTCRIDAAYADNIRRDAKARVIAPPLLGDTKVEIQPGKADEPAEEGQHLEVERLRGFLEQVADLEGRVGTIIQRVDTFVLTAVKTLDQFRVMVDRIDQSKGVAGRLIHDEALAKDLSETLAAVRRASGRIEKEALDKAIDTLDAGKELVSALQRPDGRLQTLLRDASETLRRLQDAIEKAEVQKTTAAARGATEALGDTARRVGQAAESVDPLVRETRETLAALRRASAAIEELAVQLSRQPSSVIFGRAPERDPGIRR